jgi:hypothetical protein
MSVIHGVNVSPNDPTGPVGDPTAPDNQLGSPPRDPDGARPMDGPQPPNPAPGDSDSDIHG